MQGKAFVEKNFGQIWPVHLAQFTRLLVELRSAFDGDLDLLLVMAVIGERTRPEGWSPELLTYRQLTRGDADAHYQTPINIQSVADYSGIPRETVRRKVKVLQERGWVDRDATGHLGISRRAAEDLNAATGTSIKYLAALADAIIVLQSRPDA
ncbi:helix-turn-helix domain-containing protein [Rhodovulum sp. YNF3179]|uniref:helix-turn-helix domain-containing protein n=1 Tax=Rhodovulum sp. YNF3179 TaxID=3425127 RepID=UPI003D341351